MRRRFRTQDCSAQQARQRLARARAFLEVAMSSAELKRSLRQADRLVLFAEKVVRS